MSNSKKSKKEKTTWQKVTSFLYELGAALHEVQESAHKIKSAID